MIKDRPSLLFFLRVGWIAVLVMVSPSATVADAVRGGATHEYQVKAAFIFNFVKFTEWPQGAFQGSKTPIRIAIIGPDRFAGAFAPFLTKMVKGRRIEISYHDETDKVGECHVAFFSHTERWDHDCRLLKPPLPPVLTVGETAGFTGRGGIINFIMADKKIRFEINPDAAAQAGLKISSKLLHLATIVREGEPSP